MSNEIIKQTEFFTLRRNNGGFVAELNTAALSGIPGLTSIDLRDSSELMLMVRATKIVNETLCPKDLDTRIMVANHRHAYQQSLLN